jgi:hypothetical protein
MYPFCLERVSESTSAERGPSDGAPPNTAEAIPDGMGSVDLAVERVGERSAHPGTLRVRLSLLSFTDCDYERDGRAELRTLLREDGERSRELAEYQGVVARWNRLQRHRRRLRRPLGSAAEFFAFCGL